MSTLVFDKESGSEAVTRKQVRWANYLGHILLFLHGIVLGFSSLVGRQFLVGRRSVGRRLGDWNYKSPLPPVYISYTHRSGVDYNFLASPCVS